LSHCVLKELKSEEINGKKAIVAGKGRPLILLHGFMSSKEAFCRQISFFSEYFTVFAPDLTGFGENTVMPYPYALNDYVNEFFKLVEFAGDKVSVIGHSFGCRIALKAAATSDVIEKMVLCGPAGLKPSFSLKRGIKKTVYRFLTKFLPKDRLEKVFCSADYKLTSGNLRESFKLVTNEYLDDILCEVNCPVMAVFGERDKETPIRLLKKLEKRLPLCDGVIMKNCGHFCFCEKAAVFNTITAEFLL